MVKETLIQAAPAFTQVKEIEREIPLSYGLFQDYPNPFNPCTKISFTLPKQKYVILEIYNAIGQKVKTLLNAPEPAGYHDIEFNGQNLSSSIYFYRFQAGKFNQVKKMIILSKFH